jgi:hypothetical protein
MPTIVYAILKKKTAKQQNLVFAENSRVMLKNIG